MNILALVVCIMTVPSCDIKCNFAQKTIDIVNMFDNIRRACTIAKNLMFTAERY